MIINYLLGHVQACTANYIYIAIDGSHMTLLTHSGTHTGVHAHTL